MSFVDMSAKNVSLFLMMTSLTADKKYIYRVKMGMIWAENMLPTNI